MWVTVSIYGEMAVPRRKQKNIITFAAIALGFFLSALFLFLPARDTQASISKTINYQGRLTTGGANVTDGAYDMVFKIYTAAGGGAASWTESWTNAALWTETGATTIVAGTGGNGCSTNDIKISYGTTTNQSSLAAGQTLWNTTIKSSAVIDSVNTGSTYICAFTPAVTWNNGDDLTNRVYVKNGIFSITLGTVTALSVDFTGGSYYLGVTVGADSEMAPRKPLTAVPQAVNANNLSGDGVINLNNTASTTTVAAITADSLTSGNALTVASAATAFTGSLQSITLSGNNVANTGNLLYLNSSQTASIAKALNIAVASTGNFSTTGGVAINFSGAHTGTGIVLSDATAIGTAASLTTSALTSGIGMLIQGPTSGSTLTGNLLQIAEASTGAATNGFVYYNFSAAHTGNGFQIDDATATGNAMSINTNALAGGTGLAIASSSAAMTGSMQSITLSGNNVANTGNLLYLNSSQVNSIAKALNIAVASTGNFSTTGGVAINFSGAHTGTGVVVSDVTTGGTVASITDNVIAAGAGLTIASSATNNNMTGQLQSITLSGSNVGNTGDLLYLNSSGGASIAKALDVAVTSTGAASNGFVYFNFSGAHTNTGFQLTDATTGGTAMGMTVNALAGGTGLNIASSSTGNNMTGSLESITLSGSNAGNSGNLLYLNSSGAASVAKLLNIASNSTGNYSTTGGVAINFSGNHTGNAIEVDDVTTAGIVMNVNANSVAGGTGLALNANALAGGAGLAIASSSAAMTGSMQSITLSGNNVANTGNLLYLNSSQVNSIAKALNVAVASTGNFSTTGGVAFNFSGNHTGAGVVVSDVTTGGTVASVTANSLAGGAGLAIASSSAAMTGQLQSITLSGNNVANTGDLLYLNSSQASSIAKGLDVAVASTGAASNGFVRFNFSGAHTNNGFQIDDATASGTAMDINANSLSSGTGLSITSNSTAGTASSSSTMLNINRSGTNANTAHTAYGVYSTVTNTNVTSGTNIAGYFSASGATTGNYALALGAGSYMTTFSTQTQAGNVNYTLPAAAPAVSGYALTSTTAGVMSWAASLSNPMTNPGDIIYGGTGGAPTALAGSGTNGWVLTYNTATHAPYWAAGGGGSMSIGGAISGSPVDGSILFVGNSGQLTQNNANFFWNNTNNYLRLAAGGSAPFSMGVDTTDSNKFKIYAGTGISGTSQFSIDTSGVTTIANLQMGATSFPADAGAVSWMDLPVVSAANNTVESYTAQIGGTPLLTVYAQSAGSGAIKNPGVVIGGTTPVTNSILSMTGTSTSWLQANIQNTSNGTSSSSDYVATADTGTDTTNYIDMGINSSTYSDSSYTIGGALSGYLYTNGGDLTIGTQTANVIKFHTGGTLAANERMRIDANGYVNIGTSGQTALLALGASSTARPSLTIASGTAPTTPTNGNMWYDGTHLYFHSTTDKDLLAGGAGMAIGGAIGNTPNNNSLLFVSTGNLGQDTNLTWDSGNDRLAVGLATPNYKLDVATATASDRGINIAQTATTGTNYGIYSSVTGATPTANIGGYYVATGATTNYGLQVAAMTSNTSYGLNIVSMAGTTSTGVAIGAMTGATNTGINLTSISYAGAATNIGINLGNISASTSGNNTGIAIGTISGTATANTGITLGNISGTTTNSYGIKLGTLTGGTNATVGNAQILTDTVTAIASAANYGLYIGGGATGKAITGTANSSNNYGLRMGNIDSAGTSTNNYGINLGTLTGGTTSNEQIFTGTVTPIASAGNYQIRLGDISSGAAASSSNYQIMTGQLSVTGASESSTGLSILQISSSGTSSYNYDISMAALSGATNNYNIYSAGITGGAASVNEGLRLGAISGSTGASTNSGIDIGTIASTSGTGTNYGITMAAISGATTNSYGINIASVTGGTTGNYGINIGASNAVASATSYGLNIAAITGTFASANSYGAKIVGPTTVASGTSGSYALNLTVPAGAQHNAALEIGSAATSAGTWALYSSDTNGSYLAGNLGIGNAFSATTQLDLGANSTGKSSLRLEPSAAVNVSAPNNGDLWYNGTNLNFQAGASTQDILADYIGQSITGSTSGSVLFANSSNQIAQDNANFFWDATNHRLGIGTTAPSTALTVNGTIRLASGAGNNLVFQDGSTMTAAAGTATGDTAAVDLNFAADNDSNGSGKMFFAVHGTEAMHISNGGTLSIGNTTDAIAQLAVNTTGTNALLALQQNGVNKVTVANSGAVTVNGSDSSVVKNTTGTGAAITDFGYTAANVGSNLVNASDRLQLADGTPANSGQGAISTTSINLTVSSGGAGAGSMTILRPDGKYLIILGGNAVTATCATAGTGMNVYDSIAGTTANFSGTGTQCIQTATMGAGAIALPRADGKYEILQGNGAANRTVLDPMGNTAPAADAGANYCASEGAGAAAYKRPDGKYLVVCGNSNTTSVIFDPVAGSWAAGPTVVASTTGGTIIPRPDGTALIINGGSGVGTTQIYDPFNNTVSVGPNLDGDQAANTCSINGTPSLAMRRQDGKWIILNRTTVEDIYDPTANTMTCKTGMTNAAALGAGANMIALQNNKFLIFAGNGTTAFYYNQDTDTFSANGAGTPSTIGAGAHSIMRLDGLFQVVTGGNSVTTNNVSTNMPMSSPFPTAPTAGTPTNTGSCTAGAHAYYVTFVTGGVESELGQKSNIVTCNGTNQTVALTNIPLGPVGTTARKVYRSPAGDTGTPQLIGSGTCVLSDNSTTSCSDTVADGGTAYSVTASTTWYTTEPLSNNYISANSTLSWSAMLEAVYAMNSNGQADTASSAVQLFARTAVYNSGCAIPLSNASWNEIKNSGDLIHAVPNANCVQVSVHFNRPLPKKLLDERNTFFGEGQVGIRYDFPTPTLYNLKIDNSAVIRRTSFDFTQPNGTMDDNGTLPGQPTSAAPGGGGSCTSGNHYWFVTFVTNGAESVLSPASVVQSCSGSNSETLTIPVGPSGTTARKIYRTRANALATDTPFYVGQQADNWTTSYVDGTADATPGTPFTNGEVSGPTLTRAEGSRVEAIGGQLTLPWGRLPATTQIGTTGFYQGPLASVGPVLHHSANDGNVVLALDNKQFLVLEASGAFAELYDPVANTFTDQSGAGNVPTASITAGAFAIKRPDGKFLVAVGGAATTNIYDPNAAPGSRFTVGPSLTGTAGQGAFSILNADGTYTIVHGNGTATSSIYNPVKNTMIAGPVPTTAPTCGGVAIPLQGNFNNKYWIYPGAANAAAAQTATMMYDAVTKTFTGGTVIPTGGGCGATAFQRQDGYWVMTYGESGTTPASGTLTVLVNPFNGTTAAAAPIPGACSARGNQVIPRADGTFLFICGNNAALTSVVSAYVYFPWGGTNAVGAPIGSWSAAAIASYVTAGLNAGAVSFQRPDGKWVLLNSNTAGSTITNIIDTGWYSDGQYLSEEMQVPNMVANSTLDWQQTTDNYVRMEARTANSQTALGVSSWRSVRAPGTSIGNATNDNWAQVEINMRRDFPTFCNNLNSVYTSTGGMNYCYRQIATPTVNSFQITNGQDLLSLQNNGMNVLRVTSDGNVMSSTSGGFYSSGADLAEYYTSQDALNKGDIVAVDGSDNQSVKLAKDPYQKDMIGVVSTDPGFIGGQDTPDSSAIALVGRVPLNVSNENGAIIAGDRVTSGTIAGRGMRAMGAGRVIGVAMESMDESKLSDCPDVNGAASHYKCGQIMIFVNLADYSGASVSDLMQSTDFNSSSQAPEALQVENNPLLDNSYSQPLKLLGFLKQVGDPTSSLYAGIDSEVLAKNISATGEIVSPLIVTDTLVAKHIKAESIEGLEFIQTSITDALSGVDNNATQVKSLGQQITDLQNTVKTLTGNTGGLDANATKDLATDGGLTVGGKAQFSGPAMFKAMAEFIDKAIFHNNVEFDGQVTFNQDTAGYAIVKAGADNVVVNFAQEYAQAPVVNASLSLQQFKSDEVRKAAEELLLVTDAHFIITNVTTKGFEIKIAQPVVSDIPFSWTAIAVKDAKTFDAAETVSGTGTDAINRVSTDPTTVVAPAPEPAAAAAISTTTPAAADQTPAVAPTVDNSTTPVTTDANTGTDAINRVSTNGANTPTQ